MKTSHTPAMVGMVLMAGFVPVTSGPSEWSAQRRIKVFLFAGGHVDGFNAIIKS
jgi:hypothetical protein